MILWAQAKINLGLWVGPRQPTGYHLIDTVMYPIEVKDRIVLEPSHTLQCDSDMPGVPVGDHNLMMRAYHWAREHWGPLPTVRMAVQKQIPLGAGLGGGSADAGAVLRWAWRELGFGPPPAVEGTEAIGMDVPFFVSGRPARARHYGELLTPVADRLQGFWVVLANPGWPLATPMVYRAWDEAGRESENRISEVIEGIERGELAVDGLQNDLEQAAFRVDPRLQAFRQALERWLFPVPCFLSGSGATYYMLGSDPADPEWAYWAQDRLRERGVAWVTAARLGMGKDEE